MLEPDVALTDFGLALECAVLAILLRVRPARDHASRTAFVVFFAALAAAALSGGIVHGFLPDEASAGYRVVWRATMLAIGLAAVAAWSAGAHLAMTASAATWVTRAAVAGLAAYALVVLRVTDDFAAAVGFYLPAALFLLGAFAVQYRRTRAAPLRAGMAGLLLTFIASGAQQAGIDLHPRYFNHNALYHLLQAVAMWLVYVSARAETGPAPPARPRGPRPG